MAARPVQLAHTAGASQRLASEKTQMSAHRRHPLENAGREIVERFGKDNGRMWYVWVRSDAAKYRANQLHIDLALVSGTRRQSGLPQVRLSLARSCPSIYSDNETTRCPSSRQTTRPSFSNASSSRIKKVRKMRGTRNRPHRFVLHMDYQAELGLCVHGKLSALNGQLSTALPPCPLPHPFRHEASARQSPASGRCFPGRASPLGIPEL
jgi:hypothetical protein